MKKTQFYLPERELAELHAIALRRGEPLAALVRDAVRRVWLKGTTRGLVALWDGAFAGSSADHGAALDES